MERTSNPAGGRYCSLREAAAYLGKTEKALRKLVERRLVPFRQSGRRLVFDREALDHWIAHLPGVSADEAADRCAGVDERLTRSHAGRRSSQHAT